MTNLINYLKLTMLLAALVVGQRALADSKWTVTNENGGSNTFTIKRSETGYAQTVHFRTISLSAYAGQHFTAVDMDYTFLDNEDEKTVTVSELSPTGAFLYYTDGTTVKYGFEVTDRAGFRLAYAERKKTWGTSINTSDVYAEKSVTVNSGEIKVTDGDYKQGYHAVSVSNYYSAAAPKAYLEAAGAELRMTLSFQAKESDDGYQHVQILVNQTSNHDEGSGNNNPGTMKYSSYMATFCHEGGSKNTTYSNYVFPDVNHDHNCGNVGKVWSSINSTNDVGELRQQYFNTNCRASDGRLIIASKSALSSFSTLGIRFDASGDNNDTWYAMNTIAKIQAVDGTAPTALEYSLAPGRHSKGNTVYVSVAFSEIVTVSGTPTLTTTADNKWGNLTYVDGSGTNVLTFCTTIPQNATGDLNITGFSGTITDMAGNAPSAISHSNLCTLDADFAYTINDFQQEDGKFLIKTHEDLIGLAGYVNGGGVTEGKTFLQVADITFAHTTNWNDANSTENNYTAIGYYKEIYDQKNFEGTYDGGGYTISGIRIYRGGEGNIDEWQGIFGGTKGKATIRNVNLANTRITGFHNTSGFVGYNYATIEDCTVAANVCIHALNNCSGHGGIVGSNFGTLKRCISRARLTVKSGISYCTHFGGIAGYTYSSYEITDCIADGAVIPNVKARGAIVGLNQDNKTRLTRNYYHGCKVASNDVTPSGVGQGTANSTTTSDVDGAQPLWAITLPTHASVVRTPATDPLPGTNNMTYDNGADINGVPYAKGSSVVNLSYNPATITEGYDVLLSVKKTSNNTAVTFTDNGNHTYTIASMPAADITVSTTEIPVIAYVDADGNPQSHACTPIVEGTTSYQTLGRTEGWYVVNSDVTFSGNQTVKFLDQTVHVILCDGTKFSINSGAFSSLEVPNGSLEILAQSNGSGELYLCSSGSNALEVKINKNRCIDINGGNIRIHDGSSGIFAVGGTVTIRRGTVRISGRNEGIWASNIILGCSNVNDRIYVKTYDGTVTIADGQILSDGTDTYSGTLSSEQKTAIAGKTLSAAIPYIDADGTTKYKASHDLTFITTSTQTYGNAANSEGWYCVNSDVNFTDIVTFNDQQVNIILCDGATMSCEKYSNYDLISAKYGSLAIYGQTHGTGTLSLNCTASGYAIFANTNIDINGGVINAASLRGVGIKANNAITIRRGNITTKGNEYGFSASTVTLGCATTADRIYSTGYNGTVTIADGQTLTDGYSANTYANTLDDNQKDAIKKKTMRKALGDVSYIDENGQEQICNNYKILSDGIYDSVSKIGESSKNTWYVASGNYTFNASYLQTYGHVHIILCDGASFTVNGSGSYGIHATGNLSIYGQSQGTGTLTVNVANALGKALYVNYGNLVVNGGVVNANGGEYGIYIDKGNLTVNGGSINATGTTSDIHAGVKFGASMMNVNIPSAITVSEVSLLRSFANGKYATLMLPFSLGDGQKLKGAKIYQFGGVKLENDEWVATANEVTTLQANTPYLVEPVTSDLTSDGYLTFNLNGGTVTLQTADSGEGSTNSDWQFKGTYTRLTYGTAPMTGHVYGFASKDKTVGGVDVKAGEFVKATDGAAVPPMRCYLTYKNGDEFAGARAVTRGIEENLPQSITVKFVGANGETTGIATLNTLTGEIITDDAWYTLSGTRLPGKPSQRGIYINKGNKVVIR